MVVYSADVVIEAIDDYYDDLLGREPADGEVRSYLAAYRANPSLDAIRAGIARSPEARDALAAVFRDVLDRDADPDSLDWLQQQLAGGASLGDVRESLEGSIVVPEEPGEEPPSPDEVRRTVNGLYQDVLGRDADGPALEAWQQAASRGAPLDSLRPALAASAEARGAIGSLYGAVLGREGDGAGLDFFQAALAGDDAGLDDVRAALGASDEARLAVNSLYEAVLGREGDGEGLSLFQQSLADGSAVLGDIRGRLAGSDEARAVLDGLYQDVLGHEGDAAGLDFWQGTLAAGNIELDGIHALFANLAVAGNDVASVEAISARMAFLAPTEDPAPLVALSSPDAAFLAGQVEWHPLSFDPLTAASLPTTLPAGAEALAGAPLPLAAGVPSLLTGLPDPLAVSSPMIG